MPARFVVITILCGMLSTAPWIPCEAQETTLEACPFVIRVHVDEERPTRHEPFGVTFVVEGVEDAEGELMETRKTRKSLRIQFLEKQRDSTSSLVLVDGTLERRETRRVVFHYTVTASVSGRVLLPGFAVSSHGCRATSPEIPVTVHEPLEASAGTFQTALLKTVFYIHENNWLSGILRLPPEAQISALHIPLLDVPGFHANAQRSPLAGDGLPFPLSTQSLPIPATRNWIHDANNVSLLISFELPFKLTSSGTLSCPGALVRYRAKDGDRWVVFEARSEPMELRVLPLPGEGRPDGFNPLVGWFTLHATAQPVHGVPGQPVTVTATLRGTGDIPLMDPSRWWSSAEWRQNFDIPREVSPPEKNPDGLKIVQTVRPRIPGVRRIPPLRVPFFNPDTASYAVAESEPIALHLNVPQDIGLIAGMPKEMAQFPPQTSQRNLTQNLGFAKSYADSLRHAQTPSEILLSVIGSPLLIVAFLGAFLTLVAVRSVGERMIRHKIRRFWAELRLKRRLRTLRHLPYPHPFIKALDDTLKRHLVPDATGRCHALTGREVLETLGPTVHPSKKRELKELFSLLDSIAYGPKSQTPSLSIGELEERALRAATGWPNECFEERRPSFYDEKSAKEPSFSSAVRSGLFFFILSCPLAFFIALHNPFSHHEARGSKEEIASMEIEARRNDARLAQRAAHLGHEGQTLLWKRRPDKVLTRSTEERLRLLWHDFLKSERSGTSRAWMFGWILAEAVASPLVRLAALGFFFIVGTWCCLSLMILFFRKRVKVTKAAALIAVVFLALVALADVIDHAFPLGVVVASEVYTHTGPGRAFSLAWPRTLPRGVEFRVVAKSHGWLQVLTFHGSRAWIEERTTAPFNRMRL